MISPMLPDLLVRRAGPALPGGADAAAATGPDVPAGVLGAAAVRLPEGVCDR